VTLGSWTFKKHREPHVFVNPVSYPLQFLGCSSVQFATICLRYLQPLDSGLKHALHGVVCGCIYIYMYYIIIIYIYTHHGALTWHIQWRFMQHRATPPRNHACSLLVVRKLWFMISTLSHNVPDGIIIPTRGWHGWNQEVTQSHRSDLNFGICTIIHLYFDILRGFMWVNSQPIGLLPHIRWIFCLVLASFVLDRYGSISYPWVPQNCGSKGMVSDLNMAFLFVINDIPILQVWPAPIFIQVRVYTQMWQTMAKL
jgi:hypothetical protein